MTACWLADLSDGELLQRLVNVGVRAETADRLVRDRDADEASALILDYLEAGR